MFRDNCTIFPILPTALEQAYCMLKNTVIESCRAPKKTCEEHNCAKVKIRPKQADTFLVQAKFLAQDKILGNSRMSTDIIVAQELSIF